MTQPSRLPAPPTALDVVLPWVRVEDLRAGDIIDSYGTRIAGPCVHREQHVSYVVRYASHLLDEQDWAYGHTLRLHGHDPICGRTFLGGAPCSLAINHVAGHDNLPTRRKEHHD